MVREAGPSIQELRFAVGLPGFACPAPEPRAALLIVHGLAEHSERYHPHALQLAARGISCVGYDQRGHGATSGPRTHITRFQDYLDDVQGIARELRAREPRLPLYVWGHSMGAMVGAAAAASDLPIDGLIVSSNSLAIFSGWRNPLHPAWRSLARLLPRLRMPLGLDVTKISSDPAVQKAYGGDERIPGTASLQLLVEFASLCEHVRAQAQRIRVPCLVLHGELDEVAPPAAAPELFGALGASDKQLLVFPGQRHEVHNEAAPMRERFLTTVADWLLQRLALP